LFAGTGAVGIEALSRGARQAMFVEKHRPAVALIKTNLESLEIRKSARVLPLDALQALKRLADDPPRQARALISVSRSALRRKAAICERALIPG